MSTENSLQGFAEKHREFHNHICIAHDHRLVRLLGVADDGFDFYYKVVEMGGRISYCSAVGACISLKEGYPAERYATMDRVFALNGAGPSDAFEVRVIESEPIMENKTAST